MQRLEDPPSSKYARKPRPVESTIASPLPRCFTMSTDPDLSSPASSQEPWEGSEPRSLVGKNGGRGQPDLPRKTLIKRLWIYQKERFPLVKHGLLIAIFSGSAVGYGAQLSHTQPTIPSAFVAFLSTFAFFGQMRVADEFKDLADDTQYRPYRPVPRGLVSLRELALVGVLSALGQALLALWLAPALLGLLLGTWAYFGLMGQEFFVRDWLKAHPVAYVLSHMVIVPFIAAYAVSTQTIPQAGTAFPPHLLPFLATCFCNGLVIELGRKIRLPAGEETGVETYSALWGLSRATRLWLGAVGATALCAVGAAWPIHALAIVVPILAALLAWMGLKAWPWLGPSSALSLPQPPAPAPLPGEQGNAKPRQRTYDILETPTALWTLGVYLSLGWLPWL